MPNEIHLIKLYCAICHHYDTVLVAAAQRQSNNSCPQFTDEECITIYIWGIIQQKFEAKAIYQYIRDNYASWFPKLPSYQAFNKRICYLADAFEMLVDVLLKSMDISPEVSTYLIDSMPIIVAGAKRSSSARVASEICNKGYCGSKGMYYYGVKLHLFAQSRYQTIPLPTAITVTQASENDLPVAKRMLYDVYNVNIFADKAYKESAWEVSLKQSNNVSILTPIKLNKGQKEFSYWQKMYSSAVSAVRQPIESFFNWLQTKTHINVASKVRSSNGLLSFVFARLAAACWLINH